MLVPTAPDVVSSVLVIIAGVVLLFSIAVVAKAKAKLIADQGDAVDLVVSSIGEIDSLEQAREYAPQVRELLLRHKMSSLMMPLRRGGHVSFIVEPSGLLISSA